MTAAVAVYLDLRRACGYKLKMHEVHLRSFGQFVASKGESHIRAASAVEWASLGASPAQREKRLRMVRRFAEFLRAEDGQHELPPSGYFGRRGSRPAPYIFPASEITQIMNAALQLRPVSSLRPHTYATLIGLLAVTGLRTSEALGLQFSDVTPSGLLIRNTKFQKTRLVPLHDTTAVELDRYLVRRRTVYSSGTEVFITNAGQPLRGYVVLDTFRKLMKQVGVLPIGGRLPRVLDLRHTFAVRALEASPSGRQQVGQHMLALATYMGHVNIVSTYWYLEATPELLRDIAGAGEDFLNGGRQ